MSLKKKKISTYQWRFLWQVPMATSHLKSLHTSLTVNHTYPNYPIGPELWSTVSVVFFSLKLEQAWGEVSADPRWVIQGHCCPELVHILLSPPKCHSARTMTNHTSGEGQEGHSWTPRSPIARAAWAPTPQIIHDTRQHVPQIGQSPITSTHNSCDCQWPLT